MLSFCCFWSILSLAFFTYIIPFDTEVEILAKKSKLAFFIIHILSYAIFRISYNRKRIDNISLFFHTPEKVCRTHFLKCGNSKNSRKNGFNRLKKSLNFRCFGMARYIRNKRPKRYFVRKNKHGDCF